MYDEYYASFPPVQITECLNYQLQENEGPYFPALIDGIGFAEQYRNKSATDGLSSSVDGAAIIPDTGRYGDVYEGYEMIEASKRELTDEELDYKSASSKRMVRYG